jgi:hypothetical protein
MVLEFTFLFLACVTIAVLLVHKEYEVAKGQMFISHEWLKKVDDWMHSTVLSKMGQAFVTARRSVRRFLFISKKVVQSIVILILSRVRDGIARSIEKMQGRTTKRSPATDAPVSFFLKKIEPEKGK